QGKESEVAGRVRVIISVDYRDRTGTSRNRLRRLVGIAARLGVLHQAINTRERGWRLEKKTRYRRQFTGLSVGINRDGAGFRHHHQKIRVRFRTRITRMSDA